MAGLSAHIVGERPVLGHHVPHRGTQTNFNIANAYLSPAATYVLPRILRLPPAHPFAPRTGSPRGIGARLSPR